MTNVVHMTSTEPLPAPSNPSPQQSRTQVLWHVSRSDSPAVTAVLSKDGTDYELGIAYGSVARQQLAFASALRAVERAETLLRRLEESGYVRRRRDRRNAATR